MWFKYIILLTVFLASCVFCRTQESSNGESYPYLVSVLSDNHFFCVGSIIAKRWVLTAAHCLDVAKYQKLSVKYGITSPSRLAGNVIPVKEVYIYVEWTRSKPALHDIALAQLEYGLPIDQKTVASVFLPEVDIVGEVELHADFITWAVNNNTVIKNGKLKDVPVTIQTNAYCSGRYNSSLIGRGSFCATTVPDEGSCFGFGGPLMYQNLTQVGVAVYQGRQDMCRVPDLYTNVYTYMPWIRSTIRSAYKS